MESIFTPLPKPSYAIVKSSEDLELRESPTGIIVRQIDYELKFIYKCF